LILGGGDGLAMREVLRWPGVESVTLVDLDPAMTTLSQRFPPLAELNQHSFDDPRVTVVNRDAFVWLDDPGNPFDAAIIDFPDPSTYALGKLYTTRFYYKLQKRLTPDAAISVQSTSPLFARPRTGASSVRSKPPASWSSRITSRSRRSASGATRWRTAAVRDFVPTA